MGTGSVKRDSSQRAVFKAILERSVTIPTMMARTGLSRVEITQAIHKLRNLGLCFRVPKKWIYGIVPGSHMPTDGRGHAPTSRDNLIKAPMRVIHRARVRAAFVAPAPAIALEACWGRGVEKP